LRSFFERDGNRSPRRWWIPRALGGASGNFGGTEMSHELISADSHVNPPASMWAEYLPASFRDQAPRVESTDEGDFEVFEGRRTPLLGINSMAGRKPEQYSWNVRRLDEQRSGGFDPRARLEDMDTDHVRAEVLYGG